MEDFSVNMKALKCQWIKRYFLNDVDAKWKAAFEFFLGKKNTRLYLCSDFDLTEIPNHCPVYYKEAVHVWRQIKHDTCEDPDDIAKQCVWYNRNIKIGGSTIFRESLFRAGLWTVSDLYKDNSVVGFHEWCKRGVSPNCFYMWQQVVKAIPQRWKLVMREYNFEEGNTHILSTILINNKEIDITKTEQKDIKHFFKLEAYKQLSATDFKARTKYKEKGITNDDFPWEQVYILYNKLPVSNKVATLQYKILFRIVATNSLLFKMKKINSPLCEFCGLYSDDIEHLFFRCSHVRNFWFSFEDFWNNICVNRNVPRLTLSLNDVLFGLMNSGQYVDVINTILLYGKQYIFICKQESLFPKVNHFINYLRNELHVLAEAYHENICITDALHLLE